MEREKLISGQTETTGISLINFQELRWVSTSLLHSRAYQYSTAKVYVFSDSVLCLGKMEDSPVESWKKQIQCNSETYYFSELNRIDGKSMEFDWKIFPGFTTAGIVNEIQKMMGELQCDQADFKGRIIFMSMFTDIVWDAKKNTLEDFFAVIGFSLDLVQKRSGTPHAIANQTDVGMGLR